VKDIGWFDMDILSGKFHQQKPDLKVPQSAQQKKIYGNEE